MIDTKYGNGNTQKNTLHNLKLILWQKMMTQNIVSASKTFLEQHFDNCMLSCTRVFMSGVSF